MAMQDASYNDDGHSLWAQFRASSLNACTPLGYYDLVIYAYNKVDYELSLFFLRRTKKKRETARSLTIRFFEFYYIPTK